MSNKVTQPPTKTGLPPEYRVTARVPKKLLDRAEKVADAIGVSVSDLVRMSLNRLLPEYDHRKPKL